MSAPLDARTALAFVREQGIVLASAKGSAPRLIDAILGEPINGNWWAHPESRYIYNVLAAVSHSEEVLVCRLLRGKVTLVHCRLWSALVRVSRNLDRTLLAQIREEHTSSGRHVNREIPFPLWVPATIHQQAALLTEQEAMLALGPSVATAQAAMDRPVRRLAGEQS